MSAGFVNVDRKTPMMLPPSLQGWVNDNDMLHFVIDTVAAAVLADAGYVSSDLIKRFDS